MLLYSSISDEALIKMLLPLILMGLSVLGFLLFGILFFTTAKKHAKRSFGVIALTMPVLFVIALVLWEHFRFR